MPAVETRASALTITVDADGCHHDVSESRGCFWHNYEHRAGLACRKCHEEFWYPDGGPDGCDFGGAR